MKSSKIFCVLLAIFLCFSLASWAASIGENNSETGNQLDGTTNEDRLDPGRGGRNQSGIGGCGAAV